MKQNGWKALVVAAYVFLAGSSYSISKIEKNKNIDEPIEVTSTSSPDNKIKDIIPEIQVPEIKLISNEQNITYPQWLDEIAYDVIDGKWGNGELRKQLLTEAGIDYNLVMQRVNEILGFNTIEPQVIYPSSTPVILLNDKGCAAYLNQDTILYDEHNNPICTLNKYDKVILNDIYLDSKRLVTIPYMYQGYIENDCLTNLPGTYIEVDISLQITRMFIDDELVFEADVITGNPNKGSIPGTNLGCTEILRKDFKTYLIGKDYREYVDVFMPFNTSEEGFHDADGWRSDYEYDDKTRYLTNGSHGCVNMKDKDAKELANLANIGTIVLIHK